MAATCACSTRSATHRKGIVPHGACPNFSEPPDESAFNVDKRFKTLLEVKGFMQPYITAQDSAVDAAANDRNHCPGVRMCGLLKGDFLSDWKTFPCGQKKCPSCSSINGVKICPICDTMLPFVRRNAQHQVAPISSTKKQHFGRLLQAARCQLKRVGL